MTSSYRTRCVPIVSVRLTTHYGKTKIVSSCKGAIMWWSRYQASAWAAMIRNKTGSDPTWESRDEREAKYARRCRPYFERVFGIKVNSSGMV